jgi:hypothetical protein
VPDKRCGNCEHYRWLSESTMKDQKGNICDCPVPDVVGNTTSTISRKTRSDLGQHCPAFAERSRQPMRVYITDIDGNDVEDDEHTIAECGDHESSPFLECEENIRKAVLEVATKQFGPNCVVSKSWPTGEWWAWEG